MRTPFIAITTFALFASVAVARDKPPTPDELAKDPVLFLGEARKRLWLQFAEAVASEEPFRRCVHCSKWFLVSGADSETKRDVRSDKVYCSLECRKAAAYARQKDARQARSEAASRSGSSSASEAQGRSSRGSRSTHGRPSTAENRDERADP